MSTNDRYVVVLAGWKVGLSTIDLMKLICERTDLGLAKAKSVVERVVDGEEVALRFESAEDAHRFLDDAAKTGVRAHLGS